MIIYGDIECCENVAERVGFEPTYSLLGRNPISSRTRYDLFGTSPAIKAYQSSFSAPKRI